MKFVVNAEKFQSAVRRVMSGVSAKTLNAMLNNILIEAEGDTVHLTTYDMEIRIRTAVPAVVEETGRTAIPAKKFNEVVSVLPMGDLRFEIVTYGAEENAQKARVQCQKSRYDLNVQNADGFPVAEPFVEDWSFGVGGKDLVDCLCKTFYARSNDESRAALNGVLVSWEGGIRTIAASDGRRLALVQTQAEVSGAAGEAGGAPPAAMPGREGSFILPSKVVGELIRGVDQSRSVVVHLSQNMALFELGDTVVTSKLVDKTYPNFRSVIPTKFDSVVNIPRSLFADVLNRIRKVVSENEDGSSIKLTIDKDVMKISASSQEYGAAEEFVDVQLEGNPMEIDFNPQYLSDPLKSLYCDFFQMKFNDKTTPVEITGDPGFIYILMPMRS